jgi:hypothetical protein
MKHRTRTAFYLAAAAALALASATANAAVYKWTDTEGKVTYSNTPPPDSAKVSDVTKIDDITAVPADKRPSQPAKLGESAPPKTESRFIMGTPEMLPRESRAVQGETGSVPRATRSPHVGAASDPCLRSSDPKCYERNKDLYHPYLGYAPGAMPPAVPAAVGASSGAAAGGAVGGGSIPIRR